MHPAVRADEHPFHEPHVDLEREVLRLAGREVRARAHAVDDRIGDCAVEVSDGGWLIVGRVDEPGPLVNVVMT